MVVVVTDRTWELYPDSGGYLGRVQGGEREFVVFVDAIDKLGLPTEIEREVRVFHELATGDHGEPAAEYVSLLHEIDKLSESEFEEWAVGLAARVEESLGNTGRSA